MSNQTQTLHISQAGSAGLPGKRQQGGNMLTMNIVSHIMSYITI
jgi:hypothetical protein